MKNNQNDSSKVSIAKAGMFRDLACVQVRIAIYCFILDVDCFKYSIDRNTCESTNYVSLYVAIYVVCSTFNWNLAFYNVLCIGSRLCLAWYIGAIYSIKIVVWLCFALCCYRLLFIAIFMIKFLGVSLYCY